MEITFTELQKKQQHMAVLLTKAKRLENAIL
jgi:hypothetical protein